MRSARIKIYPAQTTAEGIGLHDGSVTLLVIPISGVSRVVWNTVIVDGVGGWTDEHGRQVRCPYAPGDEIGVKEAWARCLCKESGCSGFLYRDHLGWLDLQVGGKKLMMIGVTHKKHRRRKKDER